MYEVKEKLSARRAKPTPHLNRNLIKRLPTLGDDDLIRLITVTLLLASLLCLLDGQPHIWWTRWQVACHKINSLHAADGENIRQDHVGGEEIMILVGK